MKKWVAVFLFFIFSFFIRRELLSVGTVTTSGVAVHEDGNFIKRVSSMNFTGVSISSNSSGVTIAVSGSGGGFDLFKTTAETAINSYYLFRSTAEPIIDGLGVSTQSLQTQINGLDSNSLPLPEGASNYLQNVSTGMVYNIRFSTPFIAAIYFTDGSTLTSGNRSIGLPLPFGASNYLQQFTTGTVYHIPLSTAFVAAIYFRDGSTLTTANRVLQLPLPANATNYLQNYSTGMAYFLQNSTFIPYAVNLGTVSGNSRLNVFGDIFVEGKIQNSRFNNITYPFVHSSASLSLGNISFNDTLDLSMFRHELSNNMVWSLVASSRSWYGISMNVDGKYMTATESGGQIWISSTNGVYWENVESNRNWTDCAVSLGGKLQVAIVSGGQIYMSYDYGKTWVARDSNRNWNGVAISEDGKFVTAIVTGGQIYTSSNYGVTFTARDSNRNWSGIGMSGNGQYQSACATSDQIYRSSDFGVTWTAVESARVWNDVRVSYSGQYQTAVGLGIQIYVSNDFGLTWSAKDSSRLWYNCAISMNGKYQAAAASPNFVYLSFDNGNTWSASGSTGTRIGVAMSGDGRFVASTLTPYYIAVGTAADVYTTGDDAVTIQNRNMMGIGTKPSANLHVFNSSPTALVMTMQLTGRGMNVDTYTRQLSSNAWHQTNFISAARSTLFDSVVGFKFKTKTPMSVTHLGSAFNNTLFVHDSGIREVALFQANNGLELARLAITTNGTVENSVYFSTLSTPIELSTGTSYALLMYLPINFYVGTSLSTTTSLFLSDFENRSVASSTMIYTESSSIFSAITLGPNMKFRAYGTTTTFTILNNVTNVNNNFLVSNGSITAPTLFISSNANLATPSGYVGIGISTPLSKLHVVDSGVATLLVQGHGTRGDIQTRAYGGTISSQTNKAAGLIGVFGSKAYDGYTNLDSQNYDAAIVMNATEDFRTTGHGTSMTFGTTPKGTVGRLQRMIIDDWGRVGINQDPASAYLHVRSDGALYSNATATATAIFSDASLRNTIRFRSEADQPSDFTFDNNGALRWAISSRGSANSYNLQLYNQAASPSYNGVGSALVTFKQQGRVGVLTDSPATTFQVYGTTADLRIGDIVNADPSLADLQIYQATRVPTFKLTDDGVASGYMTMSSNGLVFNTDTVNQINFRTGASAADTTPETSGTSRMFINSTGKVGINTTGPVEQLHIYDSGNAGIVIDGGSGSQSRISIRTAGTENSVLYRPGSSSDLRIWGSGLGADIITFGATSGNVGIGSTSPATKFVVRGHGTTAAGANAVLDSTDGGLRRSTSSRRYKRDIQDFIADFKKILQVWPKTFLDVEPVKVYFSTNTPFEIVDSTENYKINTEIFIKDNFYEVDVPTKTIDAEGKEIDVVVKEVRRSSYTVSFSTVILPTMNSNIEFSTTPVTTEYQKGKWWVLDKTKAKRYKGFIAEEFHDAGLTDLVIYDELGRPDAIDYANIPIYLLDVLKDHEIQLENQKNYRIQEIEQRSLLENRIDAVENNINFIENQNLESRLLAAELAVTELQNKVTEQAGAILIYRDMLLDYDKRIKALEAMVLQ